MSPNAISRIRQALGECRPFITPVFAEEHAGINRIPAVFSEVLGEYLNLPVYEEIVQINKVGHTGASGYHRLAYPALFGGEVQQAATYLLVDDFIGQGGTLANLKGYIESLGGRVVLATTLTGKPYSAKLSPSIEIIAKLRQKHGTELENWWRKTFGYGFDRLTESEARYLERSDNADIIRNRLVEARS
ncbi:MAG: phosphoribosyltransferase [Sulfuricellaceae bacterium]|nr:phosphoribosyltransferase [Sulfuricellaceae bacterium]